MKTLAVCGDSWFSSDLTHPGKSFGEVLANDYGYNLLSLARGGCSNFAINLQVKKAIELNSNIVILGATTPDRIELPIIVSNLSKWERIKKAFDYHSWSSAQPSCYDIKRGLSNVKYFSKKDLSDQHSFLTSPSIISESLNNLAFQVANYGEYRALITREQVDALKLYMLNLYDVEIKRQYDIWAINDACRQLMENNIPFLLFTNHLFSEDSATEHKWIPAENKIVHEDFSFSPYLGNKTRFHYGLTASKEIADYFQSRIEKLL